MNVNVKNKFDFDAAIRNIRNTEYGKKWVPNIPYIQNIWKPLFRPQIPCFWPKILVFDPKTVFWPIFVSFVSFVICFVFHKIRFWRNTENEEYGIRNKTCFEFRETTKIGIFRLLQGLTFLVPGDLKLKRSTFSIEILL